PCRRRRPLTTKVPFIVRYCAEQAYTRRPGTRFLGRHYAPGVRALVLLSLPFALAVGPAQPPSAGTCKSSSFRLGPSAEVSEKTGQPTATFVLTNAGAACAVEGYPTIVLLDAAGRRLRFTYRHSGDQMITTKPPRRVAVAARGKA